jgi:lipoprotein-releasing system ATP-binding protein
MVNRNSGAAESQPGAAPGGARVLVRDLWKVFQHGGRSIEVLRGINLDLEPGALVSVVGASGVGKSTLMHLLGTLDVPTSGQILFDGVNVTEMPPAKLAAFRNREIGFVFQFHHLLPEFTALENAMMPGLIARRPRPDCRDRAEAILARVGLQDRLRHRPAHRQP